MSVFYFQLLWVYLHFECHFSHMHSWLRDKKPRGETERRNEENGGGWRDFEREREREREREKGEKKHSNSGELEGQINAAPGTSVYQDRD